MKVKLSKSRKNKAFSLVEIIFTIALFSLISYSAFIQFQKFKENQEFILAKTVLVEKFYLYSQKSLLSGEKYEINLDYLQKKLEIKDKNNNILEMIELPKKIKYTTVYNKRIVENIDVKITETGNISPSFSIYLSNKNNKVYYRISLLGFSMIRLLDINIYKPIKNFTIDYENIIKYNEDFDSYVKDWVVEWKK